MTIHQVIVALLAALIIPGCVGFGERVDPPGNWLGGRNGPTVIVQQDRRVTVEPGLVITPASLRDITRSLQDAGGDVAPLEAISEWFFLPYPEAEQSHGIKAGQEPAWRLHRLSEAMAASGVSVDLTFDATRGSGARVRHKRVVDKGQAQASTKLTDQARARVNAGMYNIWAERAGIATSSTKLIVSVYPGMSLPIALEETR